ncbi:endo-alpha-N-acetylgalactosaminidase family protein [Flavihumibacter fluvii]|uniref:endo-alpha-N-acetylgalactosaminidase family protein n=1 Tax=Flavihumibacter fluvii TaxID=2838157 RepID=UPI001BDF3166|nr:endo-alpha-N-acetylgalactosaminidase family protein [Flavihumibacter fluvii]ULQ52974.1 endo-alpha-N-acetylgalactosaminidase family protein [Flavihumibacter fluvii]
MKRVLLLTVLIGSHFFIFAQHTPQWRQPYHQSLVMKLFLSIPDGKGGSIVAHDFSSALAIVKTVDQLTLGVPKIIYLVGWQYNGHDDKYPAFFAVNAALKRKEDATARESLLWLMEAAKEFHTTISLHINMTDAYEDSPLWSEYVDKDMLSKQADGSLLVIGNYNNKKAYQINYRQEWKNGYAQKRIDQLLELVPALKDAGTIHLDAWIARDSKGHAETMVTEAAYQQKVAGYWRDKGIDVTTEWVMDYMTGIVPYYWHFNGQSQAAYLEQPASLCTGSKMNPDLKQSDFGLEFLFGTSMYGENHFPDIRKKEDQSGWTTAFTKEFFLNYLQYHFLNRLERLRVEGVGQNRKAFFAGKVISSLADSTVEQDNRVLRRGNTVCFPVGWREDKSLAAFSTKQQSLQYSIPGNWNGVKRATVFNVTKEGLVKKGTVTISAGKIDIALEAGQPILMVPDLPMAVIGDTTRLQYPTVQKNAAHPAYHQALVMKLFMSQALFDGKFKRRDNGQTQVYLTAGQALDVIRRMDQLTLGIPKIVYLVGWQYNGHDSGYPAWFQGNEALKRKEDKDALESLRWLMREAKQYHTRVSLHINMFDAYEDSPLWETYIKENIIARKKDGSLLGGEWGYPISYAQEWATGYAQKRIDSLCKLLPIQEAGTIHIDAFHTWPPIPVQRADGTWGVDLEKKPTSTYLPFSVADETAAQKKIYAYWEEKGIDVTSEGVDFLREESFVQYQSMAWWFTGLDKYLQWPASVYTGGRDRSEWGRLFGTSMHGEEIIRQDPQQLTGFKTEFCLNTLVMYYLNRLERMYIVQQPGNKEVHFTGNVSTQLKGGRFRLKEGNNVMVDNQDLCMPAPWIGPDAMVAYSKNGYTSRVWTLPKAMQSYKTVHLFRVTQAGQEKIGEQKIRSGKISLSMAKDEMVLLQFHSHRIPVH